MCVNNYVLHKLSRGYPFAFNFNTELLFGLPRVVQSGHDSKFVCNVFKQVMSTLGRQQYLASVYHLQSQGVLERLHQTLKNMLNKYCHETGSNWGMGLLFLLYAIRSA